MRFGIVVAIATLMMTAAAVGQTEDKHGTLKGDLPTYPNAKPMDRHPDGRYTLMLKSLHGLANGASYSSEDRPQQVLEFYRDRLKGLGELIECRNGTNAKGDLEVDERATAHPGRCYPENFAAGGTLLKAVSGATQRIVVVLPQGAGSEISLFIVRPEMY